MVLLKIAVCFTSLPVCDLWKIFLQRMFCWWLFMVDLWRLVGLMAVYYISLPRAILRVPQDFTRVPHGTVLYLYTLAFAPHVSFHLIDINFLHHSIHVTGSQAYAFQRHVFIFSQNWSEVKVKIRTSLKKLDMPIDRNW